MPGRYGGVIGSEGNCCAIAVIISFSPKHES